MKQLVILFLLCAALVQVQTINIIPQPVSVQQGKAILYYVKTQSSP
jgi:hypothetical protein